MPGAYSRAERLLVRLAQLSPGHDDLQALDGTNHHTTAGGLSLSAIHAIFWDVGGVLLTNAWDRVQRMSALERFHLDEEEFHDRHEMVISSFERGKITLDEYLERTIFYRPRPFTRDDFKRYMFSLSQPQSDVLEFARQLSNSGKYLMATINNESTEL